MKYKNPHMRKIKNTHPLLVTCSHCGEELLIYQKGGRRNLIKLLRDRIIESNMDLSCLDSALTCPSCERKLGSLTEYNNIPTYYLDRGMTRSKRLGFYKY